MLLSQSFFWVFLWVAQKRIGEEVILYCYIGNKPYPMLHDNLTNFLKRCKSEVLEEHMDILIGHVNEVLHKITEKI